MRIGDVLEAIATACLVAATYVGTHLAWATLAATGVSLLYFAQCYASHEVHIRVPLGQVGRRLAFRRRKRDSE